MMVCPIDDERVLIILQVDHSQIAGLFAANWGNEQFTQLAPYASMVVAIQEHDSGWWDWEIKPTLNSEGRPPDYIGSIKQLGRGTWLDFYTKGISRVAAQDQYAGYMVSMHGDALLTKGMGLLPNMPDYSDDELVQQFIAEQKAFRTELLSQLRVDERLRDFTTDEALWTNFKYMEVFDQLAQFVCNRYPFNSTARKNGPNNKLSGVPVPVRPGEPDTVLTITPIDETRATLAPYPFDVDVLEVAFPARIMPNRSYGDQDEFLHDFYTAPRTTITYTLQPA